MTPRRRVCVRTLAYPLRSVGDPNWFYSTLAQSTAAIVGLAGGFLATRLISHRNDIAEARGSLRSPFQYLIGQVTDNAIHVRNGLAVIRQVLAEADRQIAEGTFGTEMTMMTGLVSVSRSRGYPSAGSDFLTEERVALLQRAEDVFARYLDVLEAVTPRGFARALIRRDLGTPAWLQSDGSDSGGGQTYWDDVSEAERTAGNDWRQISIRFDEVGDDLLAFRSRLVQPSTVLLIMLLAALLVVGTILPMRDLSAHSASSRMGLLIPFAVLSLGVVSVLVWETLRIRRAANLSLDTF